jgi:hypothetical protein
VDGWVGKLRLEADWTAEGKLQDGPKKVKGEDQLTKLTSKKEKKEEKKKENLA